MNRPLRTYQAIWLQLRTTQECVIEVLDPAFVPTLKSMIIKEKCRDVGFHLMNEVERFYLRFDWDGESKKLTVHLKSKHGLTQPCN